MNEAGKAAAFINNLGTRWRGVVSFTNLPLYVRGNRPRYLLCMKLSWSQNQCGSVGGKKSGIERQLLLSPAHRLVTLPTTLARLLKNGKPKLPKLP